MSAAAMQLSSSSRIILTGTPVQNYLGELWNLFQFLNPGLLGSFEQFHSKFTAPIEGGDKERSSQLKRIIQPFILRRTKAEVVDELPDKTDITRMVEFSPEETIFYEALRQKAQESLASEDKVNVNALAQITMLREAACSATLLKKDWAGSQSKISTLMELIPEILEGGNGLLVFSQFTSFLHLCAEELDKAAIPYFFLEGSTTIKKREEMVQDFQAGKKKLFLISLKAGGLGLNLTGANYVIHLDPWWNPAIEQQATDRAYRIGQKQNVTVYHLISQHTIEEKIVRLHKFKRDMADAILEGTNVSHALTMEELRDLVKL
jgi:SNF2 family DNA or RNA helicase